MTLPDRIGPGALTRDRAGSFTKGATEMFVAVITSDGYPTDDDVRVFGTAAEAWQYLADERKDAEEDNACDETCQDGPACEWSYCADLTDTWVELTGVAEALRAGERVVLLSGRREQLSQDGTGTVEGATPGYHGTRDVPTQYTVRVREGSDADVTR